MTTKPNPYGEALAGRDAMEAFAETAERIRAIVERWAVGLMERSYAPGKWTARQIIIHLAQTELALTTRVRFALTQADYQAQPFSQDDWMGLDEHTNPKTALDAYTSLRRMNTAMFRGLSPEQLARTFHHPEYGLLTVQWVLEQLAGHDLHHLKQIEQIK
jgi:DinB family protein